ncbi:hypothetical protein DPEC_G00080550 [Dallia pectoralis]|uniref:Uncharacterized protein n=1 Tax=Dallia pectoralis TaxID=75939 RepID=A0ACC2H520_DALPE|nr:hypothetical protein DPEC_G00080550 [Dallia pectoralis]
MSEESEPSRITASSDPTTCYRPEITQDNSHLLASIFKDLYTSEIIWKDTVAYDPKTRSGGNSYHAKYVERLKQVYSEYSLQMRDADMLENHIVMGRVQSTANESEGHSRVGEELGQANHQLGFPAGRSNFTLCVDSGFLKSNNLICPEDYITELNPLIRAPPAKSTPGFAKSTISYRHRCDLPPDDGYSLIPLPEKTFQRQESDMSLIITCSSDNTTLSTPSQWSCQEQKPKWMDELNASSKAEELASLHKLQQRHNFLRNPRFLPPTAQQGARSLILSEKMGERRRRTGETEDRFPATPVSVFLANPPVIYFNEYIAGQVYEMTLILRNVTASSRQLRVIPPTTPHFSLGLGFLVRAES